MASLPFFSCKKYYRIARLEVPANNVAKATVR